MKTKKTIFIVVCILVFMCVLCIISKHNIVIPLTKEKSQTFTPFVKGDTVNLIKSFNFNKGKWIAYLVLSNSDLKTLPVFITRANCLKMDNIEELKELQSQWKFIVTGGDLSTVESYICFFNNGKIVFKSGISLENSMIGLQNQSYGYLEAQDNSKLIMILSKFKRVYYPIVIL